MTLQESLMSPRLYPARETLPDSSNGRFPPRRPERPLGNQDVNLDRPLPPTPSSSLPTSYEIPSLRQKPSPPSSNSTPTKHGRSISHPFPSLFGGRKTDKRRQEDEFDSSDGGTPTKSDVTRSKSGRTTKTPLAAITERQPRTGKCMTCDAVVRWPHDIKVFRCTTCLTINDLEPFEEQSSAEASGSQPPVRRTTAISLLRTKRMIDYCMNEYFERLLSTEQAEGKESKAAIHASHSDQPQRPTLGTKTPSEPSSQTNSALTSSDRLLPPNILRPSTRERSLSNRERLTAGLDRKRSTSGNDERLVDHQMAIFRSLENYIADCFLGCTCLNISFFSIQPIPGTLERRESEPTARTQDAEQVPNSNVSHENFMSELDAKTLLLGDVVENGSWWTGNRLPRNHQTGSNREKSPERWRGIVSVRSPRIHWSELAEWYHVLVNAGGDWQRRWQAMQPGSPGRRRETWQSISIARIHHDIVESQSHLQRCLLKSTENLLKRPRRPLKNPEDCRFLLMLLTNPLLSTSPRNISYTSSMQSMPSTTDANNATTILLRSNAAHQIQASSSSRKTSGLGHHSGIIKRILGLMANLPNDVHTFLVSWLSRYSDNHFQNLVEIISSFVTYRLCRQQDRIANQPINPTAGLVPTFSDSGVRHPSELHAALDIRPSSSAKRKQDGKPKVSVYGEDWQIRAAARIMSLLFQANSGHVSKKRLQSIPREQRFQSAGLNAKYQAHSHGQIVPISNFYNTMLDQADLVADFEAWEATKSKFTFCQYPFFFSIWAKIRILEYDARRQMEVKAREAFFDSILSRKTVSQYLVLKVRRDCLVEDSLKTVSEVIGSGGEDLKKGLRIDFVGEEGIDAGGLRKEWFLSIVREIFDPLHGLFIYDEDSQYCYFNPYCLESSEQFFLVGVLLGLAIYNSTILDIAFPPFVFKKLLASAPTNNEKLTSMPKLVVNYTLEDLAEFRPVLAKGLRHLLEFEGDVQETFCREFTIEVEKYGEMVQAPLCTNGHQRAVTNSNRREFVDLYIRYMLDTAVTRQYEPFKRGFFTVCGGNALSLFRPEEIELLIRGSDEPLDVTSLKAVATYENWPKSAGPPAEQLQVEWFWDCFESASPSDQRKLLGFITGSDRIPAMGATNLNIKLQYLRDKKAEDAGIGSKRFPIARTCFNTLGLYGYDTKQTLESKLWTAVFESEGFGLK